MLCRFGKLTKTEIGAIRVRPDETHVELAPAAVERFLATIGPARTLEDKIVVTAMTGPPQTQGGPPPSPPRTERPAAPKQAAPYKKPFKKKDLPALRVVKSAQADNATAAAASSAEKPAFGARFAPKAPSKPTPKGVGRPTGWAGRDAAKQSAKKAAKKVAKKLAKKAARKASGQASAPPGAANGSKSSRNRD